MENNAFYPWSTRYKKHYTFLVQEDPDTRVEFANFKSLALISLTLLRRVSLPSLSNKNVPMASCGRVLVQTLNSNVKL